MAQSFGQERIFRALPIDLEQNDRLNTAETRLDRIETSIDKLAGTVARLAAVKAEPAPTIQESQTVAPQQVATAPQQAAPPTVKQSLTVARPAPTVVQAPRAQTSLAVIAWQAYPDGVYRVRHADVQPRNQVWNHLIQHGFSREEVQGLSQFEALAIHDLAHGGKVHPGQYSAAPAPMRQPAQQYAPAAPVQYANYDAGCANGQCARPSQSRSAPARVGLFGLFRR